MTEVCEVLGCSRSTLDRMRRDGQFPAAQQILPNKVGWPVDVVATFLDERRNGLLANAVANPDDLAPEALAEAAVDMVLRAIEHEIGEPADAAGLRITYGRPTEPIPEAELANAEAEEASLLRARFADFDVARSCAVAAWLFPELRPIFAAGATDDGLRRVFLDEEFLRPLALSAMNEVSWERGLAKLKSLSTKTNDEARQLRDEYPSTEPALQHKAAS